MNEKRRNALKRRKQQLEEAINKAEEKMERTGNVADASTGYFALQDKLQKVLLALGEDGEPDDRE
jgi:hypothetical protein